ncbi:phage portal protein [Bacteroides sp.]|uniref:phage portal protein n=1 Tax=Bacteroides sp. TaxID=29523 RepID=UPI0026167147|nr:phage portal protein [Bacteroides sp.]MDD3039771.1 phage portal protein [Bacteroides sp.]
MFKFPDIMRLENISLESRIDQLGTYGKPQRDFLQSNISNWILSKKLADIKKAKEYYKNRNDIKDHKRYYIDRLGVKQEEKNLSNAKLSHPFFRKLVNQKVNYLLGKQLSLTCEDESFREILKEFFTIDLHRSLQVLAKESCQTGISWLQAYYDKGGNLRFKHIPSDEVIAFWADTDHTKLDAVIRVYTITKYEADGTITDVMKVEYHTAEGVWYYEMGDTGLINDPDQSATLKGHFTISKPKVDSNNVPIVNAAGEQEYDALEATWENIPFIPFKYNSDEVGLLDLIKPLVDDYDEITSSTSNTIKDIPNSIKVVKNYDGTDKAEFTQNINTYRTAFVAGDGDVDTLETKLDITTIEGHLSRLRKDIYEAGSGVDTQETTLGNVSGVALKFRYADLDMDVSGMITEFTFAIEQIIWFIRVDAANKGKGDFRSVNVTPSFNIDVIINEKEVIGSSADSVGIISDRTIVANHPWVTNAQEELEQIEKEKAEKVKILEKLQQDTAILNTPIASTVDKATKAQRIARQKMKSQKDPDRGKTKELQ